MEEVTSENVTKKRVSETAHSTNEYRVSVTK
jgi:hypothetical protein